MAKATLIQIVYHEAQKEKCYPFAHVHFTDSLTVFFENYWIEKFVNEATTEKIAVCSWKLRSKMRYYIGKPRELTQSLLESDYDVLAFTKNTDNHRAFQAAEAWHPGFTNTFRKILSKNSIPCPGEVKIPIYQNAFSARTDIYKEYVSTYLSPCMEVMVNDKEISELCMQNSRYSDLTHQSADNLEAKIGLRYYPMHAFLLERLFSVFVQNKKLKVTPL